MVSACITRAVDCGLLAMSEPLPLSLQSQLRPYRLSVVMIVKNEAHNLRRSLPAVADWADEIILLDSGSTDDSQEVAALYGAQWFVHADWHGFGQQRQRAQQYATGDWILALDADEEVTPALRHSILHATLAAPGTTVYGLKRIDFIFGHAIDNPHWIIPLKAHWRLYPRHFHYNNAFVHEALDTQAAQCVALQGYLHHHTVPDLNFWLQKRLQYALTWATERHHKQKKVSIFSILIHTAWSFIKQYIIDGRFLMGAYGFIYALIFMQYTFNKYALLYDLNRQPHTYQPDYSPHSIHLHPLPPLPPKLGPFMQRLSVVLIIKNEVKHLAACLYNIYAIADEIIILDSGSTDESKVIAEYFGVQWFVNTDWQGFGIQRQLAQQHATGDYVLMLDADEGLDNELKADIMQLLNKPLNKTQVYAVKRINIFCGYNIHSKTWYYGKIVRLYANGHFKYHPYKVHESVNTEQARVHLLKGYMLHYTNNNLYHFLQKTVRYSQDWGIERLTKCKRPASLVLLPLKSGFAFLREYMLRGSIFSGTYGFFLAAATAHYNLNKYLILWVENHRQRPPHK